MKILLAGSFAATPLQGGAAWAVLQYALGLEQLGHEVMVVEPTPRNRLATRCFSTSLTHVGFVGKSALLHRNRGVTGMSWRAFAEWAQAADVLLNLGGALRDPEVLGLVRHRVYVDLDPGFTQLWHSASGVDMGFDAHHRFVSVGCAVGTARSTIPTCGVAWIPTVPPIVLDRWPVAACRTRYGLTTVANWRSYGSIQHDGVLLGQKAHSVREFFALPSAINALWRGLEVEPALAIDPAEVDDLDALARHGWHLHDPATVARDVRRYHQFIQASTMEIGIAKSGYVRSGSGWFSDRSACYLASGRPVIAQDTGWTAHLPAGEGLLACSDTSSAAEAVVEVMGAYDLHRRAARRVAEQHLDSRTVLARLLDEVVP